MKSTQQNLTRTRRFKGMKKLTNTLLLASALLATYGANAGFQVSGTQLLDGNGNPFVMRGVNHAHAWYTNRTQQALADIASVEANTVRVVLSDGQQWTRTSAAEVANIIQWAKNNKLIAVLEVHDVTGSGEQGSAGTLYNATSYWIDIASTLQGQEDYVIINIANEPFGNGVPESSWIDGHIQAIQRIRSAGLTHTLMIDAANWGQDWQEVMLNNASTVAAADSRNNTMFSVHMYEVYQDRAKIEGYVSNFLGTHNLPLIVGEFGADHYGNNVDEDSILAVAEQYNIGYLGWSWSGNSSQVASLDITNNWNVNSLSAWGDRLINGTNGIRATAEIASVFNGGGNSSSSVSSSTSSSVASSTPSSSSSSSSSLSGGEQCNWYGTLYPLCSTTQSGWGWEQNRSCVARSNCSSQPAPYGIVGGGTASSSAPSSSSSSSVASSSPSSSSPASSSSSSATSGSSSCTYVVTNQWGNCFTGAIRITNKGNSAINGWSVNWNYTDGSRVTNSWNATVSGSNPYSASNVGWNAEIQPGQTVEFGFQGTKNSAQASVPTVSGSVCN